MERNNKPTSEQIFDRMEKLDVSVNDDCEEYWKLLSTVMIMATNKLNTVLNELTQKEDGSNN